MPSSSTLAVAWTAACSGSIRRPKSAWFDVDFPDVIEIRQRVYPAREKGYRMIGASVTEPGMAASRCPATDRR